MAMCWYSIFEPGCGSHVFNPAHKTNIRLIICRVPVPWTSEFVFACRSNMQSKLFQLIWECPPAYTFMIWWQTDGMRYHGWPRKSLAKRSHGEQGRDGQLHGPAISNDVTNYERWLSHMYLLQWLGSSSQSNAISKLCPKHFQLRQIAPMFWVGSPKMVKKNRPLTIVTLALSSTRTGEKSDRSPLTLLYYLSLSLNPPFSCSGFVAPKHEGLRVQGGERRVFRPPLRWRQVEVVLLALEHGVLQVWGGGGCCPNGRRRNKTQIDSGFISWTQQKVLSLYLERL